MKLGILQISQNIAKSKVLKGSLIYLLSSILNKSIPFLLLPVMTKYLLPSEYGKMAIFLIIMNIYDAIIGMSLQAYITKFYYHLPKNELAEYIGNILTILFISALTVFFITLGITTFTDYLFSIPTAWFLILPLTSFFSMTNILNLSILRNEEKPIQFGIFEISKTAINASVTVILVVFFTMGWKSQVYGIISSYFVFFFVAFYNMRVNGYIKFKYDFNKIKTVLKLCLPLIPHALGVIIIGVSDRVFIERMVNVAEVGLYSVGYNFGMIILLFTDAFIKAWSPWFFKNMVNPDENKRKRIVKYTYIYIIALFILAFVITSASHFAMATIIDKKYEGSMKFVFWVTIGYAIQGIYKIFFPYLVQAGKTSFLAFSSIFAAIVNMTFTYIFILNFGTIGAAYATILAFAVSAYLVFWYQKKFIIMPWFSLMKKK